MSGVVLMYHQILSNHSQENDWQMSGRINPLTPLSGQVRISPYNINTISSGQVVRI